MGLSRGTGTGHPGCLKDPGSKYLLIVLYHHYECKLYCKMMNYIMLYITIGCYIQRLCQSEISN